MRFTKYKYNNIWTLIPTISIIKCNHFTEVHIEFLKVIIIIGFK